MPTKSIFRGLLILTIISAIISMCAYLLEKDNLPLGLREYLNSRSHEVLLYHYKIFVVQSTAFLLIFAISFSGLYFFWSPARVIYCVFIVIGLLTDPSYGAHIKPGWTALWDDCYKILSGVIICLIFTSPIRELFRKHGNQLQGQS
jgi:hypothetical protein